MFQTIRVDLQERAVVLRDGLPTRALGPGHHTLWGFGIDALFFDTRELVFDAPAEVRAVLGESAWAEVRVATHQRGVLYRRGRPAAFLRPGTHFHWAVEPSVELHLFDVSERVPELTDELLAVIPRGELMEATVLEYQRGLLYVRGRFERVLDPGRYAFWTRADAPVSVRLIDMRRKQLVVAGQELLTRDKVTLRLSLTLDYAPADPATAPHTIADAEGALYSLVQLAIREHVATVTLDELLEGREALTAYLRTHTEREALRFGIRVEAIGVRDIVLPGDMKVLLNRVIEAEKQAAADAIFRREEAAAIRTKANAAKVMADNPVLLRLEELEAYERIAGRVGEVKLTVGSDELERLAPALRRLAEDAE